MKATIDELTFHLSPDEMENMDGICFACRRPHIICHLGGWRPDLNAIICSKCGITGCSESVGECDECDVQTCIPCGQKWCEGTHDSGCHISWCEEHIPAASYATEPSFDIQCSNCLPELSQRGFNVKGG